MCQNGTLDPAQLYESPFIDFDDDSVFALFGDEQAKAIIAQLQAVNDSVMPQKQVVPRP